MKQRYVVFEVEVETYVYDSNLSYYNNVKVKPFPIKVTKDGGRYIDVKGNYLDVNKYKSSYISCFDKDKVDAPKFIANIEDRFKGKDYEKKIVTNTYGFVTPLIDYKKSKNSKEVFDKIKQGLIPNDFVRLSSSIIKAEEQLKQLGIKPNIKTNKR